MSKEEKLQRRLYQIQTALSMWSRRETLAAPEREATAYYVKQARRRLIKALKAFPTNGE